MHHLLIKPAIIIMTVATINVTTYVDGNKLLEWCESPGAPEYGAHYEACIGYVSGVADAWRGLNAVADAPVCAHDANAWQMRDATVNFLRAHPCSASSGRAELLRGRLRRLEEARINPAVRGRGGVADLHPVLIPRGDAELETLFRHLHSLR
jgi:Ssp1 endopeptidase immunity protein Rap1a